MEPLLLKEFAKISPLQILAYNNTSKIPYSEMPLELIVPEGTVKRDLESETPESASGTPNKGGEWSYILQILNKKNID